MSSWVLETTALPQVNDLVQVTFDWLENPRPDPLTPELSSRVEDEVIDERSGRITQYVIAAPFFVAANELPSASTSLFLRWPIERGVGMLPVSFAELASTNNGLRQWRLTVKGPAYREQRRRFFRVPISMAATLRVGSDLPESQSIEHRVPSTLDVGSAAQELPELIDVQVCDVSEGGMLWAWFGLVLPDFLPVMCTFTLEGHEFAVNARVIWSVGERSEGRLHVKTALNFEHGGRQVDLLRSLLFQQQRRDARQRSA